MLAKRLLLGPLIVLVAWMAMAFFVARDYSTTKKKLQLTLGSIGEPDDLNPIIRGILSVTQVSKQLGRPITESHIASSIADLAAEA